MYILHIIDYVYILHSIDCNLILNLTTEKRFNGILCIKNVSNYLMHNKESTILSILAIVMWRKYGWFKH